MRIFLDANVLISVLNNEYPLFTYSSRILSLADNKKFKVYTSPVCLAIAFYFSEKKSGTELAKKKIAVLCKKLHISSMGKDEVLEAAQNEKIMDFEDGIQYYSALNSNCEVIITEDRAGFYYSKIKVVGSQEFLSNSLF
jgi:predicted nucleic acid-binding protein